MDGTTTAEYIALLERVNNIHGTGLALANVFIALLACALAGAGIFAAFVMWRNSREQKEERLRIHEEYAAQAAEQSRLLVATYEEKIKELVGRIEQIADDAEGVGDGVANTKQELETLVSDYKSKLEHLQKSSEKQVTSRTKDEIPMVEHRPNRAFRDAMNAANTFHNNMFDVKNCPHCGKGYRVSRFDKGFNNLWDKETCPHCGGDV